MNYLIWLIYFTVSLGFYALGRNDEEKSEESGMIAVIVTNAIVVTYLLAKTFYER